MLNALHLKNIFRYIPRHLDLGSVSYYLYAAVLGNPSLGNKFRKRPEPIVRLDAIIKPTHISHRELRLKTHLMNFIIFVSVCYLKEPVMSAYCLEIIYYRLRHRQDKLSLIQYPALIWLQAPYIQRRIERET